MSFQGSFKMV